jgi:lycopene beta-cyclase
MSTSRGEPADFDCVLVGGGLQNALVALALLGEGSRRVALVERRRALGGNHTWCFHAADVAPQARALVEPLVVTRWDAYRVLFPDFERRVPSAYAAISSDRLHEVVCRAFRRHAGARLLLGRAVRAVREGAVELDGGERLQAPLIVDARGPERFGAGQTTAGAYQKFVGLELELGDDAPISEPLLMDARVQQLDGFRFVYVLPFARRRVLIEDTYFSDGPVLDVGAVSERVLAYAAAHGFAATNVLRRESGVLPLPIREPLLDDASGVVQAGYQGGWFHPTTGYSLPVALRLATTLAAHPPGAELRRALGTLRREHARQLRFAVLLNRLLFCGFEPDQRWNVLARFYGLPESTIDRFYALTTTAADRARILCGRPPPGLSLLSFLRARTPRNKSRSFEKPTGAIA